MVVLVCLIVFHLKNYTCNPRFSFGDGSFGLFRSLSSQKLYFKTHGFRLKMVVLGCSPQFVSHNSADTVLIMMDNINIFDISPVWRERLFRDIWGPPYKRREEILFVKFNLKNRHS